MTERREFWDLGSGRAICTLVHPLKVSFASFASDETVGFDDVPRRDVTAVGCDRWQSAVRISQRSRGQSGVVKPSPGLFALRETDVAIQVWDLMLRKRVGGSLSVPSTVRWAVFSPDSRNIAVAASDGTVRVWAVENSEELTAPMKLGGDITRIEFSPDGQTLAIAWGGRLRCGSRTAE